MPGPEPLDWNVAVYCANEQDRLRGCLETVFAALAGRRALVTLILNGSRDHSPEVARSVARAAYALEVFWIATGDKSNAINQFIHALRSPARFYGAVDGYVHIGVQSFSAMEQRLTSDPAVVAVSGVSMNGRTMRLAAQEALTAGGRLHGGLHAFRRDFLDRIVARKIRLPLGLYSGDGLLGSMAAHNLDAMSEPWTPGRIAGVAAATFDIPVLSPLRPDDVGRQFRRKIRQMRGRLQNAALKEIVYRKNYEGLPEDADDMVRRHIAVHGTPRVAWPDRLFQALALHELKDAHKPEPATLVPQRL